MRDEIRRPAAKCTEDAAEALLAAVGNDLRELAAACSQLIADTDGRIDADTVARYYRGRAEVSGFTVADAAMVGDVAGGAGGAALGAARRRRPGADRRRPRRRRPDGGPGRGRRAGATRTSWPAPLGMPAWKIERAQQQARGWTPEGLVEAMRAAAECNAAVKGGCRRPGVRPGAGGLRGRGRPADR